MTIHRFLSMAVRLLGLVVLVTSGTYLLVYLYRWEWNRALISGLFFVAAEVALATGTLMRRFDRIERRLVDVEARREEPRGERTAGTAVERPHPFAWLEPDGLGVFVPVLLGIGVILSAIAYVVERVAALSGVWENDRAIERRFALVGGSAGVVHARPAAIGRGSERRDRLKIVTAGVSVLVVLGAVVLVLAGLTQYEADGPGLPGTTTTYVLSVEFRGAVGDPLGVTETLTTSCRALVDEHTEIEIVEGPGAIVMRLSPSPGDSDERRFLGCLNDAALDRVRVEAERIESEQGEGETVGTPSRTFG